MWTHVAFAQHALDLVKCASIATGTSNIWQVRDAHPEVVRKKIPEAQTDWTTFCDAIKKVEVEHIKKGVRKHKAEQEEKAWVCSEIDALKNAVLTSKMPDTPTKEIRGQLGRASISQNILAVSSTEQNPFIVTEGGRGNLLWGQQSTAWNNTHTTRNPEDEHTIIRETFSQFPMADTHQTWMEQV